jgi:hypothetical protein
MRANVRLIRFSSDQLKIEASGNAGNLDSNNQVALDRQREEVDDSDAEPLQRGVAHLQEVLGPAVRAGHLPVHDIGVEIGG